VSAHTPQADPQLYKVLRRNLRDALNRNDLVQAHQTLGRLEELAPLALDTRALSLELLVRERRFQEAAALAGQLLVLFPGAHRVQYLAGVAAYKNKDYPLARDCFAESERLHPFWKHRRWLGKTLTNMGELDRAEPLLAPLVDEHPECLQDLAWLYERGEDRVGALALLERHRQHFPDDRFVAAAIKRLRAESLTPQEIAEEIALAEDLGEEPAPELVPGYVEALLVTGQGGQARAYVQLHSSGWTRRQRRDVAWVCHRLHAADLAFEQFLTLFPDERGYPKYMNAMEKTAELSGRLGELTERYRAAAPSDHSLYGRIKRLEKRLAAQGHTSSG
jgi:tetratricopeptide (TPR) repeat protein